MTYRNWIINSMFNLNRNEDEKVKIIYFWTQFYDYLLENTELCGLHGESKSAQYKDDVFQILYNAKESLPLSKEELRTLQMEIEEQTILFDEESIHKSTSNIIRILIREDEECAKDYLRGLDLAKDDIELLSEFGHYTIEALIVHVLGMVFNQSESNLIIRVSSLVEQLESNVRMQASLLKSRRCKKRFNMSTDDVFQVHKSVKKRKRSKKYPIGSGLVDFMVDRGVINLMNDLSGNARVMTKKGSYYVPRSLYAVCNFDISLLPIKLNLPMVCEPLDWRCTSPHGQKPRTLSDLSGGYLSSPTGEIYDRYRLLSTKDINNFNIDLSNRDNYEGLCDVMNKLQRQAFRINSDWLKHLLNNEKPLVEYGLLMPGFLASININSVSILLREFHMKDNVINQLCSYTELLHTLCKNIQCSRYEQLIIKLALAYEGYNFYLPAFLDFRGRIYRSGILHFHERDLARSLIVFADEDSKKTMDKISLSRATAATAFHYKAFNSVAAASEWYSNNIHQIESIEFVRDAKRPFQFLANTTGILASINDKSNDVASYPIIQDASASAYQIMSYFMLDETMAKRTNLIPSPDGVIQDVYANFLEELKDFMKVELERNLSEIVCKYITRKHVKGIFMPKIYGKTLMSTAYDLREIFSQYLTNKECFVVASACFKFWKERYAGMECLIRHIGWIASSVDRPVFYKVPYFTTVQDYMIMDAINIWVYDRLHKKRRRVTLRVSSSNRDRRKTEISTFVNFIHQKDANIAMKVVAEMLSLGAPIYTVHDNFISTAEYCNNIPLIYSRVFHDMGPPLSIINEFIYINVIKPIVKRKEKEYREGYFANMVIPKEMLSYYLKENVPDNISKKMMTTWEERITGILSSYENYTRNVCGDFRPSSKPKWRDHEQKWAKFQLLIKCGLDYPNNCVHY